MIKNYTFLIINLFLSVSVVSQHKNTTFMYDACSATREHKLDFERMRLSVEFEPEKGLVKGKITHFFSPIRAKVDSFFLDGPGIIIKEAKLNGQTITYKTNSNGITFYPSKTLIWGEKDSLAPLDNTL